MRKRDKMGPRSREGDEKSATRINFVIPAEAGTHLEPSIRMDPRLRGDDSSMSSRMGPRIREGEGMQRRVR
jgi:hypothetical protein